MSDARPFTGSGNPRLKLKFIMWAGRSHPDPESAHRMPCRSTAEQQVHDEYSREPFRGLWDLVRDMFKGFFHARQPVFLTEQVECFLLKSLKSFWQSTLKGFLRHANLFLQNMF